MATVARGVGFIVEGDSLPRGGIVETRGLNTTEYGSTLMPLRFLGTFQGCSNTELQFDLCKV